MRTETLPSMIVSALLCIDTTFATPKSMSIWSHDIPVWSDSKPGIIFASSKYKKYEILDVAETMLYLIYLLVNCWVAMQYKIPFI